jgi:N6-adenosine-specific RNA methylase IME4
VQLITGKYSIKINKHNKKDMQLKESIIFAIRSDKQLRAQMMVGLNITETTLYNWLRNNSKLLTTADCLNIISKYLGIGPCDLYEEKTETAKA